MMRLTRSKALAISTTAMVAILSGVPQAPAQTLMDMLRGNRVQREAPPQAMPPAAPVQRAAPPRVSGPSYYTYKTDALVRVDFAAITPERADDHAALPTPGIDSQSVGSTVLVAQAVSPVVTETDETVTPVQEEATPVETPAAEETAAEELDDADEDAAVQDVIERARSVLESTPDVGTAETLTPPAVEETQPGETVAETPAPEPLTDEQIAALQQFELMAEKEAADAIVAHYTASPEYIWVSAGALNDDARAALRVLGDAASHALNPEDYALTVPGAGAGVAELAAFEMELSARVLRYARDAQSGRIDPNRISGYHDFAPKELDREGLLRSLAESDDVASVLEAQHPQNEQYRALRVELEMLRASAENDIVVAPNTLVRPGETNPEFPKILTLINQRADEAFRAEHGEVLTRHLGSETYVQELGPVIKAAQAAAGVGSDGVIGPRTVQALAGVSKASRIEKVEMALEQARWLPSDLTDRHVFINTPAFTASYVEDGQEKLSMRTVVGGLSTQTYFFQDEIQYVEFHPFWGVPRSILVNKYLPKLYSDPSYLDRNGFEVVDRRGRAIPSSSVNWAQYGANLPYDVRQRPGRGNALGEMKIMFPNSHAIYMHDTPEKHLFDRDNRALSNGCVRLADPRAMAAAVLGWDRQQVDRRLEGQHGRENLSVKVPVYVAYFTAWPNAAGTVEYFNDVYSRDEKTREAIEKVEALRSAGV